VIPPSIVSYTIANILEGESVAVAVAVAFVSDCHRLHLGSIHQTSLVVIIVAQLVVCNL
jgi:hypothetical protein